MTRRILLIDDSPLQLRVREEVLRNAGLEVLIATSADSGLALLRTPGVGRTICVVVTDHVMPGVSGPEFVRELRDSDRYIPVIVVTGLPNAEDEYEGLDVVVRQKPCPPAELIALVWDCVRDKAA